MKPTNPAAAATSFDRLHLDGQPLAYRVEGPAEVLVFSPCLLHGAAANHNADATHTALEMRFWSV